MKNRINHTGGLTIVELLIVIVVIAVLTLISVTVYSGVQQQAYYSRAKQELNMMSRAVELYNLEYGTYPDEVDRDVPLASKSLSMYHQMKFGQKLPGQEASATTIYSNMTEKKSYR